MKCPVCTTVELKMTERQGVEIDYCPECRGVWLDRGELDKIIERSSGQQVRQAPVESSPAYPASGQGSYGYDPKRHDSHDDHNRPGGYPRKKSWLSELFD
jgi:Zn-finger nucleic acid-binding protein